jgi:hypothetical protein
VKRSYVAFGEAACTDISIWPVGIDTEKYTIPETQRDKKTCIIYIKRINTIDAEQKIIRAKNALDERGIASLTIEYGKYTDEEYRAAMRKAAYCIWIAGTESQNIAIMEMLSTGLPIYVIDDEKFIYENFILNNVSSAPYFDARCGIKAADLSRLDEYLQGKYNPRDYILNNHTLEKSALLYYNILRGIK